MTPIKLCRPKRSNLANWPVRDASRVSPIHPLTYARAGIQRDKR
jgi:hypothetical protein